LILICLASFLLRLVIAFYLRNYKDDYSATDIGMIPYNLFHGHGYTYGARASAYFGPGYSFLWAGLMYVFGATAGQLAVQLLQALALSLLPIVWYFVALKLFDNKMVALLSAAWLALYPELLVLSATMYSDSIVLFLWVAFFGLLVRWQQSKSNLLGVLIGLSMAGLVLTKGRMLAFVAVALAYFFILERKDKTARLGRYVVPLITAALLMAPWVVRNWVQLHAFIPTESSLGYNVWIGHNEHANGTGKYRVGGGGLIHLRGLGTDSDTVAGADFPKPQKLASEVKSAETEPAADAAYRREALTYFAHHPRQELSLSVRKVFYGWWRDPKSIFTSNPAYILPWLVTLLLFLVGLVRSRASARTYGIVYVICLVSTLLQVAFFVVPRFRLPVYPFVFLVAALGLTYLLELLATRNERWRSAYSALSIRLLR
jgi:4-amino-4-deoxy-L-arabinose transferase-like glycosyltransferase